ncbi:NmrA/HSCARG family protein [Corallococcus terminator]|uniref:NmrA/HSCARG family protein n=1 Tax=Corallococcus terminator TaxID=2316733 RepID=UPI001ABF0BEC|nr:NmrA/HSCARG family protein [Corallococcus terminator]
MSVDFTITVLVTGATGQQGGAVVRQLLNRGHKVVALVRDPTAPAARALQEKNVRLVQGDFDDVDALEQATRGVDAVYAMATNTGPGGPDAETHHGMNLADAAKRSGVRHYVYSSVAGADQLTGVPHFDSKHRVELYLRRMDMPFTILGPTFFMENLLQPPTRDALARGMLMLGLPASRGLQMVTVEDLAGYAMHVMEDPERFIGERIEVASDEVTGQQSSALLSMVSGHRIHYEQVPLEQITQQSEDLARMYEWLDRVGYHADILTLRNSAPRVGWQTFETWARHQDWGFVTSASWPGAAAEAVTPQP